MGIVWTCCTGRKELKLLEYMPDKKEDDTQAANIKEKIMFTNLRKNDFVEKSEIEIRKSLSSRDINKKITKIYDEEPIIVEESSDRKRINTVNKYYDEEPQEDVIPSIKRNSRGKNTNKNSEGNL